MIALRREKLRDESRGRCRRRGGASQPQVKALGYNRFVRLRVVLEPSDEGGFTAYVPSLPGCISEGETIEEAMANLREAVELYLEPQDGQR